jgi:hypothetical protein
MAQVEPPAEQLDQLRQLFDELDADSGGELDRTEVAQLAVSMGQPLTEIEIDEAMAQVSYVDSAEVCSAACPLNSRSGFSARGGAGSPGVTSLRSDSIHPAALCCTVWNIARALITKRGDLTRAAAVLPHTPRWILTAAVRWTLASCRPGSLIRRATVSCRRSCSGESRRTASSVSVSLCVYSFRPERSSSRRLALSRWTVLAVCRVALHPGDHAGGRFSHLAQLAMLIRCSHPPMHTAARPKLVIIGRPRYLNRRGQEC